MGLEGPYFPPRRSRGGKSAPKDPFSPRKPMEKREFTWETLRHGKNVEQIAFFNFGKVILLYLTNFNMLAVIAQW